MTAAKIFVLQSRKFLGRFFVHAPNSLTVSASCGTNGGMSSLAGMDSLATVELLRLPPAANFASETTCSACCDTSMQDDGTRTALRRTLSKKMRSRDELF